MAYLSLIRHGRSDWNDKGLWTGLTDIPLDYAGWQEAHDAAKKLSGIKFDFAFTSDLERAQETLDIILRDTNQPGVPIQSSASLNERDYGDYTGKNKWEVEQEVGEEMFEKIRRSFDYPIPNGESLKQVYERVVPFYEENILPKLKDNQNVLISAHGNSLRALIKHLKNLSDEEVEELEIPTGEPILYRFDPSNQSVSRSGS